MALYLQIVDFAIYLEITIRRFKVCRFDSQSDQITHIVQVKWDLGPLVKSLLECQYLVRLK